MNIYVNANPHDVPVIFWHQLVQIKSRFELTIPIKGDYGINWSLRNKLAFVTRTFVSTSGGNCFSQRL